MKYASALALFVVCFTSSSLHAAPAPKGPDHVIVPAYERFHAAKAAESKTGAGVDEGGRLLLGEMNCTSCHAIGAGLGDWVSVKKAPLLTTVGDRVRAEWIAAYLDNPQRMKPGTTMPDLFADLERNDKRTRIEALTHFLMSTATEAQHDGFFDGGAVKRGETQFHEVGCAACHNSQKRGAKPIPFAMPLGDPAAKYTHDSLATFLRDPLQVRPSGRMPHMNLNDQDASDIAAYFLREIKADPNLNYTYYEGKWERLPKFDQLQPLAAGTSAGFDISVAKAKNNFGLRFEGYLHLAKEERCVFRLKSDDGAKLYIDDILIVDYDGIHPAGEKEAKASLKEGVHKVVVEYFDGGGQTELAADVRFAGKQAWQSVATFLTLTSDAKPKDIDAGFKVDAKLAKEGRRIFENAGCASCHELKVDNVKLASTLKAPALRDVRPDAGCTTLVGSEVRGGGAVPRYALSPAQQKSLRAAIEWAKTSFDTKPTPTTKQRVAHTFAALNCYACHQRDGVGGVDPNKLEDLDDDGVPDRDPTSELLGPLFVGTTPEMGDEGRLPPKLDGVGAKLTEAYLKHILDKGSKDRPYVRTMMPRFGGGNVLPLVAQLNELDKPITATLAKLDEPEQRVKADGRLLVGTKGFGCVKCHMFNKQKAEGIQGIDLTIVTKRVRPEWFVKYVMDPQSLRPGTRMPTIFPGGKSPLTETLHGDAAQQIAGMWAFLSDGSQAATPIGVGGQPIELVADKEPVIYRGFIQGAGVRAIGVGYPEKVNLAFDAEDLRPALLWRGSFIDAAKHWTGRGNGFQGPMGDEIIQLAPGPNFAKLRDKYDPWPVKSARELGYQFRGYTLDDSRTPTFQYRIDGILVTDRFHPYVKDQKAKMLRSMTFHDKGDQNYWFRVATGREIKPLADNWYDVDGLYRVRVGVARGQTQESQRPILRKSPFGDELIVKVRDAEVGFQSFAPSINHEFDW
ncbi:MAG: c-type cytochrome [Planctomycetes bacterium]|nr:c-type cytochrome [Planctomycetota bacterium]